MGEVGTRGRWFVAAFLVGCTLVGARPASAEGLGERTLSFHSQAEITADGALVVSETIAYQFAEPGHGIVRSLVTQQRFDDAHARVYPLDVLAVSSPDGAPTPYTVEHGGAVDAIRIGDPDVLVEGRHTYEITYRLRGVLNDLKDHVELYWNATGFTSEVPTDEVSITVQGPAAVTDAACYQGGRRSTVGCDRNEVVGDRATFEADQLGPRQGVTVVVALPDGSVSPPPRPILETHRTLAWGFRGSPERWGGAALALVAAGAGVGALAYRKGRDRQAVGSAVDVAFAGNGAVGVRRPFLKKPAIPVQFEPPDHLPPGLYGTLVDERADVRDISATIVDLAVRGYLRIEEVPGAGGRGTDYRLVSLRPADDRLRPYEALLLGLLFASGPSTELSELRTHFHQQMAEVRDSMYTEVVAQGWYRARPDRTRRAWVAIGVMALLGAVALTAVLAATAGWGLVGVSLVLAALALLVFARWMPARTAKGSGLLNRALGFRTFIEQSERHRARFAERAGLFTEYLPYAIALGATQRWARAFAGLAVPAPTWYVGSRPFFEPVAFGVSMSQFSAAAGSALLSTPAASGTSGFSGAGFAGGGVGGGGVGSW